MITVCRTIPDPDRPGRELAVDQRVLTGIDEGDALSWFREARKEDKRARLEDAILGAGKPRRYASGRPTRRQIPAYAWRGGSGLSRNAPCPCGSGAKAKRCPCGAIDRPKAAQ